MGPVRGLITGCAWLAASATAAHAADMPRNAPLDLPPPASLREPVSAFSYSGWYLRGDLGYRWGHAGNVEPKVLGTVLPDLTNNEFGGAFFGGLGFGLKTQWLRTDVTIDYAGEQDYTSTVDLGVLGIHEPKAKVQSTAILVNGYLDLGTWYGATPYIGAGAGTAYVKVSDFGSNYWSLLPPLGLSPPASHGQWNFAWAVMGGVGYKVAPNLMLDLGYRYLNVGDATSDPDALIVATLKNLASHEFRIGLRWSFDDLPFSR